MGRFRAAFFPATRTRLNDERRFGTISPLFGRTAARPPARAESFPKTVDEYTRLEGLPRGPYSLHRSPLMSLVPILPLGSWAYGHLEECYRNVMELMSRGMRPLGSHCSCRCIPHRGIMGVTACQKGPRSGRFAAGHHCIQHLVVPRLPAVQKIARAARNTVHRN